MVVNIYSAQYTAVNPRLMQLHKILGEREKSA